ncbi:MAG: hypothetical protein JJT75_01760 [Opitutales bacterium]|nr:hypothetical protein [Opitutales bacterium]MCH8541721.1 hypothetical protein [Opitutales bacterium]
MGSFSQRGHGLFFAAFFSWMVFSSSPGEAQSILTERLDNFWPGPVTRYDASDEAVHREVLGPLFFRQTRQQDEVSGLRPIFLRRTFHESDKQGDYLFYPLFTREMREDYTEWNYLLVGNYRRHQRQPDEEAQRQTTIFPVYFRGTGPREEDQYLGIFPIAGRVPNQLFHNEAAWVAFPFYTRLRSGEVNTYYTPFPFVRTRRGPETRGFEIWPLFGRTVTTDQSRDTYALWPLIYDRKTFSENEGEVSLHGHSRGFLPFYSHHDDPDLKDRNWVWPFFGYTESQDPEFREVRYFWPFSVQRRGETHYTNRWAPFYTYSERPQRVQRWVMWPFYRQRFTTERGNLLQTKTQFLYFLYWDVKQEDPRNPEAGTARKTHLWPFYSHWDNAAGTTQNQFFSPLEVFFPRNQVIRDKYSPLFAIYRSTHNEAEEYRSRQFLFQLLTYERKADDWDFQVGPVLQLQREEGSHGVSLLRGLLSFDRQEGHRILWIPFGGKKDSEEK